jgi:hypothetical protein
MRLTSACIITRSTGWMPPSAFSAFLASISSRSAFPEPAA